MPRTCLAWDAALGLFLKKNTGNIDKPMNMRIFSDQETPR